MNEFKKEYKVTFEIGDMGTMESTILVNTDGVIDTSIAEEDFYKLLRKTEVHMKKDFEENKKEWLVDNLTKEQEDKLQDIHSDQADGVLDDDLSDDYECWLMELSLSELEELLK